MTLRVLLLTLALVAAGCHGPSKLPVSDSTMATRDINDVLRAHDKELMAIPGVVGVYVGLKSDGKTQCLKVMAARKTPELVRKIPKSLEGYPVEVEETGVIRPMEGK